MFGAPNCAQNSLAVKKKFQQGKFPRLPDFTIAALTAVTSHCEKYFFEAKFRHAINPYFIGTSSHRAKFALMFIANEMTAGVPIEATTNARDVRAVSAAAYTDR